MKAKKIKYVLLILILISTPALAEIISKKNWMNNPSIIEIRNIYNLIENSIKANKLNIQTKEIEDEETNLPIEKTVIYEKKSNVRKYIVSVGSDDSALSFNYYYDSMSNLRFVFITGGAVNGTYMEHRIYIDGKGNKIWEIQKITKGPGYPFKQNYELQDLVHEPWADFNK
ncbi:hypothetical protein EHQ58_05230 [Leptospira ognonensis]|uniref:Uncharacterized protein n=1 Tax=Leptospira ognonensis TaxID=2484945 RepID=A0A4R9K5M6_9LEPT|nr:hypothetical protein [Leptospira ognonensis]TGL61525.1 hypothetical protein EHQ58_05230 [Leptospira ognonensis]